MIGIYNTCYNCGLNIVVNCYLIFDVNSPYILRDCCKKCNELGYGKAIDTVHASRHIRRSSNDIPVGIWVFYEN
jgi:hypothetical protein